MAALFDDMPGYWFAVRDGDPRALSLYVRHYSARKNGPSSLPTFCGPGEKIVLLTPQADALFIWRLERHRHDNQTGINCAVFRNESPHRASDMIREAMDIAWRRWPGERLFTYVWDSKVKSVNPGYCFKRAGWRTCGRNADGRLTILEALPPTDGQSTAASPAAGCGRSATTRKRA